MGDYNRFIRYSALASVVGSASRELRQPDFALRLSSLQTLDMMGPIAVMARHSGTVESALLNVVKYLHTYSPAIRAELHPHAGSSLFEFTVTLRRVPYRAQMVDLSLGVILGMFRHLCGPDFSPIEVRFQHSRLAPERAYTNHFGSAVQFEAERNVLVFPTGWLARQIDGGDDQVYALAAQFLGNQHRHLDIDQHVYELMRKLLPLGQANLVDVSQALMLHPRTLQRRLAELGTTFEGLLDEMRQSLATELLGNNELPIASIATQLGYSEQSTFTRGCRRWFGASPLAVRRRIRSGVARDAE